MNHFLKNWTYPKHGAAVSGLYLGLGILGNAILGKPVAPDEKSCCPITICRQLTKAQRIFNGILAVCYAVDMSVTYLFIRRWKKQYK